MNEDPSVQPGQPAGLQTFIPNWKLCARKFASAVGYAMGIIALLTLTLALLGVPPLVGLQGLWTGAFGDATNGHAYAISETLVKTAPLLLTGLSVSIAWNAGLFSIGAEGQLLVGALGATAVARLFSALPGPFLTLLMLTVAVLSGALWGAIAGWLRVRRNVQEVISTIMLNYIALFLLRWAVRGPLQGRGTQLPESDAIPDAALFAHILSPTRLHSGVFLAVLAVPCIYLIIYYTRAGFAMRLVGQNAEAARTARYNVSAIRLQAMAISGGLSGLAGAVELLGVTERLSHDFSAGWGFTAIPVALLGGLQPVGLLFSALFFGALTAGSGNLARFAGISSGLIYVIQAVSVLAIVAARAKRGRMAGEGI